ncbi:MAG: holo-ACP synthase [Parcubacteria group bacterium]|nr:holo-ACP synthase [Parcubacteria group bacterium]
MSTNTRGIGVDVEEVNRFRKLPYKGNPSFYKKIFTADEIKYCLSKADPYPHFAVRFAAKEAVLKCLQSTIYKVLDVEIRNNKNGAPNVKVKGQKGKFLISFSHTKNQVAAIALWLN